MLSSLRQLPHRNTFVREDSRCVPHTFQRESVLVLPLLRSTSDDCLVYHCYMQSRLTAVADADLAQGKLWLGIDPRGAIGQEQQDRCCEEKQLSAPLERQLGCLALAS